MNEYLVMEDGTLHERYGREQAEWAAARTGVDALDVEAHFAVLRTSSALLIAGQPRNSSISPARYQVLRLLYQAEGRRMLMSDLGVGLSVTQTNITKLVEGLVQSGHVQRVVDDVDKRKAWAQLTDAGAATFEEVFPVAVNGMGRIWENLRPAEKRQLVHLLAKLKLTLDTGAANEQSQRAVL